MITGLPSRWDPKFDEEVIEYWKRNKVYEKWKLKNRGKKVFFYLDGPPYVTGSIHLGTAWGKAFRDMVIRYFNKKGFDVFNRPGFDMHGLPIEQKVEKSLGIKKKDIEKLGVENFVKKCREFSYGNMYNMIRDFKREGVWLDWDNPYMTMSNEYIENIWRILKIAYEKGYLYEDLKVVHWCPRCQTTLSKQEVELGYLDTSKYKPSEDPSIYVKFRLKDYKNTYLLIWTTTPWTLVFNLGVMVNPNALYVKVKIGDEIWIVAKERLEDLMKKFGIRDYEILEEFLGKKLEGLEYIPPFFEELHDHLMKIKKEYPKALTVWLSEEYVTTEEGTGLVHAAPGCGPEDYEVGKRYGVKPWNTTDEEGYIRKIKAFEGLRAKFDDNKFIELVKKKGLLVYEEKIVHDYPICWRCGTKLIFRATKQWFLNIQKIKEDLLEKNKYVKWIPESARKAFENVISNAPDWVISRQRYWGIPLPIWKCDNNHILVVGSKEELEKYSGKKLVNVYIVIVKSDYAKTLLDWMLENAKKVEKDSIEIEEILSTEQDTVFYVKKFDEKILKELESRGWFYIKVSGENYDLYRIYNYDLHKPWIDNLKLRCPICGREMKRVEDVADVWLDSGGAFLAVFERSKPLGKVDFIVEGFDQLRGWFYTLAVEGMLYEGDIPYKAVYVHGYVNDALGRKMSKSLGNVVTPSEIWDRFGADTLRFYLSSATGPYEDLNFYIQEVKTKYNSLNILWNIHRYLIDQAKYYNVNPKDIEIDFKKIKIEDRWMLSRLNRTIKEVEALMENYQLWKVPREIEKLWLDLSREYIKHVRDRLQYGDLEERKTVIKIIYDSLMKIINVASIFIPFITEKIYLDLKKEFGLKEESIHLLEWPKYDERLIDPELEKNYEKATKIIESGLRIRNKIKLGVRWPLRTLIIVGDVRISEFADLIKRRLNVKDVKFVSSIPEFLKVKIKLKDGKTIEDKNAVKDLLLKGYIIVGSERIEKKDIEIEINSKDKKYEAEYIGDYIVILDRSLDQELLEEGTIREFIRRLQEIRKKMKLVKNQKIDLFLESDEEFKKLIRKWEHVVKEIVGIDRILFRKPDKYDNHNKIKIRDREIEVYINVL